MPTEIVPSPQGESYTIVQKYDETASRNDTTFEPVFSNNPAYQPSNQPVVSHNQENHVPWERVPGSPVATTTMPVGKVTSFPMQGQPGMNGNSNGNMPIHSRPMETAVYQPSPGYYPPNGVQQTMPGGVLPDTSSGMSSPNSWGQPQQTRIAPNQVNGFGAEQPYFGQGQPLQAQAQSYPSYPAYEASTNSLRAGANDYTPVSQQVSYSGTAPASYQQPGQSPYGIACSQVQIPVPPQGNLAQYPSAQQPPYTPNGMTPPQNYSLDTGRSFRDQVDPLNSQINSQYPSQPTEIARGYQQQNFAPNSGSAGLANPSSNNYR
ncbi:MAG: hypothetical protein FWC50_10875 [Planctomycetaceae bacterium]|nr:hypothetical protein [Planctomycetaceae bacterium]